MYPHQNILQNLISTINDRQNESRKQTRLQNPVGIWLENTVEKSKNKFQYKTCFGVFWFTVPSHKHSKPNLLSNIFLFVSLHYSLLHCSYCVFVFFLNLSSGFISFADAAFHVALCFGMGTSILVGRPLKIQHYRT